MYRVDASEEISHDDDSDGKNGRVAWKFEPEERKVPGEEGGVTVPFSGACL